MNRHLELNSLVALSLLLGAGLFLLGCDEIVATVMVNSVQEPAGENCLYGGVRLESGLDDNENGQLDSDEIDKVSYSCNARVDGYTSLLDLEEVEPGEDCAFGGLLIHSGLDLNEDQSLQEDEISASTFLCKSEDGHDALVELTEVDPDMNGPCYFGGTQIDSGVDLNRDGVLSEDEITSTQFVCAVHINENLTLVEHSLENPGENCEWGGIRIETGYDLSGDGVLDPDEVEYDGYICNQVVLVAGKNSLIELEQASSSQCPGGGYVYLVGLDDDYDNSLSTDEIDSRVLVCNGVDGYSSLIDWDYYEGSECANGGFIFFVGADADGDNILDSNEVYGSEIICHGADGYEGYDGYSSLIEIDDDPWECEVGVAIMVGLDEDGDFDLDSGEIEMETVYCFE